MILALCGAHFVLWFSLHLTDSSSMLRYETWTGLNHSDPRSEFIATLASRPENQLVLVRNSRRDEWVHNESDIATSKVIWAHDLGPDKNEKLLSDYPNRTVWLFEPDSNPPGLTRYPTP